MRLREEIVCAISNLEEAIARNGGVIGSLPGIGLAGEAAGKHVLAANIVINLHVDPVNVLGAERGVAVVIEVIARVGRCAGIVRRWIVLRRKRR